jgi:hypothetical protein
VTALGAPGRTPRRSATIRCIVFEQLEVNQHIWEIAAQVSENATYTCSILATWWTCCAMHELILLEAPPQSPLPIVSVQLGARQ